MDFAPGTRLGPYEIIGMIGAGGMGEVYRARDTRLGRQVAIKVLPAQISSDPHLRERLSREARVISSLAHPHICTLFDIGQQDGIDYLVMEHLDGQTLADALARGPLPLDQMLRYGAQIANAVAAAHRQGIIHRDLKPGNIMLTKSGVKVLDFGLASSHDAEGAGDEATEQKPLTERGEVLGTLQYMAPEQLRGITDARSDIFALGAILYEMATGRRAFEGKNRTSVIAAILQTDPAPMPSIQPMTPPALDHIVRRCLAKDPDDRLQSARDLEFALNEITQPLEPSPGRARRAPAALLFGALALLIAIAAGVGTWLVVRRRPFATEAIGSKTIAVLPFANLGVDKSRDYLRLAIPDEITTILTYSPELAVRPFSASRRMAGDIDPQDAAKKLGAAAIVSGHLMDADGRLSVTLEAIDVERDTLLWRDVFEVASTDLITMRGELSSRIRSGLLPKLAAGTQIRERSGPRNPEAYAMYLRAVGTSNDPQPNKEALGLLENAVRLDPNYAPAWNALALRSYYDYSYSDGGPAALARTQSSAKQALQLDPDLIEAAIQLIEIRVESGELVAAWQEAKRLVSRRPNSSDAHFALSYALRYGGALRESAAECNKAWSIDRRNRGIRSCAVTFHELGEFARAIEFTRIDAGSQWSNRSISQILMRQGKYDEAVRMMAPSIQRDLLAAWLSHAPPAEIDRIVARLAESRRGIDDGEPYFLLGGFLSVCERPKAALDFLREAIRRNYCSFPAVDSDPTYANVRALPEFRELHAQAVRCHEQFMAALKGL